MIICTSLAEKYRQINRGIAKAIKTNVQNIAFWKKVRQDYGSVFKLCQAVDDHISNLLILSFANNILVILVQLYNSIKLLRGNSSGIDRVHFIYAFLYIICRATAVALFAASVNEEGSATLKHLFNVSTEAYNVEVEKLLQQIYVDPPLITGKRFFYLKKPLIMHIAVAIVSYELILIQFKVIT
ncbi:gustatory receptor for sugar taste 64f-like [Photinus pyralis]|uniref:gustatory receptor for sugar taste 64f-like n=1 Tax=Photinus pyralis TaxID=7054 RepID=UPI00126716BE|nr:gustatory receptor for sugar taste 64f-like [Photinus pyralis]